MKNLSISLGELAVAAVVIGILVFGIYFASRDLFIY